MQSLRRETSCGAGSFLHERARRAYQHTPARWHRYRCQSSYRGMKLPAAIPDRPTFLGQDEYSFSLTQYMVVLDKPIGLTLAPNPTTGHVYVQHIEPNMSAAESKLILVGDRLVSCSAVFGDEMWHASDLQRTRWAINNRPGKVKLVLERGNGKVPPWYFCGREGIATWEVPELQLPIQFNTPVGGELTESLPGVGRTMTVSFNRCMSPTAVPDQARHQVLRPGLLARRMRAEALEQQLMDTAASPDVDISSPVSRLLAGKDGARFQVGVSGAPLQAGGTINVLPFRRHNSSGSGSSTPNPNSSSSSQPNTNSSSSSSGPAAASSNNSNSIPNSANNVSSNSNSTAAGVGAPGAGAEPSSSSSNGSSIKQPGSSPSPAAAAAAAASWGGSAAGAAAGVPIPVPKKVVQVLPWLLVSNARLNALDLTRLATTRSLECLLEMRLIVNQEGLLCPIGSQPPPFSLPAAPVPPTLSPATTPAPAPENPPPMPPQQQQEQQQQQQLEQEQQQEQQQQQQPAGLSADLIGIAGPDVGFASSAATAAAVAAAAQPGGGSSSSSAGEPSQVTLHAHAILHCMADLHRLAVRRRWTPKLGAAWQKHTPTIGPTTAGIPASGSAAASGAQVSGQSLTHGVSQGLAHSDRNTDGSLAGLGVSGLQQLHSQLLLSCDESSWGLAGLLLVSWLHWHCGLEESSAVEGVSKALGVQLDTAVLSEVRRLLVVRAKERFSRLMLAWPYGGLSAEVSGDLVGGWTERVAMRRCMKVEGCHGASKGHFYLELKGLHPGRYHYKFIIDNTWDIDPAAPKTLDSQGNWNNVLDVKPPPRIESPEEENHFAALHALCTAYERKLRPVGSLF